MSPRALIALFKVVAVAEALSWVGLLFGMYFKYVAATTEVGVRIFELWAQRTDHLAMPGREPVREPVSA